MARRIQIKRGLFADLPVLAEGELAYCIDTKELYIGTAEGVNVKQDTDLLVKVTWQELKDFRDAGELVPGLSYRIIDYVTTTVQEETQSARHVFDVIVTALDESTLSEEAKAIQHEGDSYFANSKLEAWQVWYSLDNDTNRFVWADEENGKGVIYRMIDEWNNDCPYDFKNIQFIRKITEGELDLEDGIDTWVYTFNAYDIDNSSHLDGSSLNGLYQIDDGDIICKNNMIKSYNQEGQYGAFIKRQELNNIVFLNIYSVDDWTYFENCANAFGNGCFNNSFGSDVRNNSFGNDVNNNSFGNGVYNNSFGNDVNNNSFGNDVYSNSFGNSVNNNSFGNSVYNNTFGNSVNSNSFGNSVNNNSFGNSVYNNTFGNYFVYNTVKNYVQYVRTPDAANPNAFQYVTLENGLVGASGANRLNLEGIQAIVGYNTPIKVARGVGTEIVAVWQNGIALAGLRKASSTTADWS